MALATAYTAVFENNHVILHNIEDFDLSQTLDCGQAFRWQAHPDGGFVGVVRERICHIVPIELGLRLNGVSREDFELVWRDYFDLDRDYTQLKQRLCKNPILAQAIAYAPGIRLLRQEPWEALCSFIISQNNNVARIKGIIDRLCRAFGMPLSADLYSFPTSKTLANLDVEALAPLRAGFRARYLLDAARRVESGAVDLESLRTLPLQEAREQLMQIVGVGQKVADCVLLYGCGRLDCVPMDVWMRRTMARFFPEGMPDCAKDVQGIAQQYLFHSARTCPGFLADNPNTAKTPSI